MRNNRAFLNLHVNIIKKKLINIKKKYIYKYIYKICIRKNKNFIQLYV